MIQAQTGTIRGMIVDQKVRVTHVGKAVVFLCDASSGLPILTTTKKAIVPDRDMEGMKDFWFAVTDQRGSFEFVEVPAGTYRLVTQSWSGTEGMINFQGDASTFLILHGTAEGVEVTAGNVTDAYPRSLGDGVLKIVNDPEEEHAFLLISRKPRLGDGVLGPASWGPEFLSALIGVTRMEKPYVTIMGLPEGEEVYVGLFNYDNNPGVGGDSYVVGKNKVVRLPIYATWSNGKYEPPPRLAELTDYLEQNDVAVSNLLGLEGSDSANRETFVMMLRTEPDRMIQLGDLGQFRLADILAASTYRSLRQFHRQRQSK